MYPIHHLFYSQTELLSPLQAFEKENEMTYESLNGVCLCCIVMLSTGGRTTYGHADPCEGFVCLHVCVLVCAHTHALRK